MTGRMGMERQAVESRLAEIEKELAELGEVQQKIRARWELEKELIASIRSMKEQLETLRGEATELERRGDLARVAEIRYGSLITLEKELEEANQKLEEAQSEHRLLKEEVDVEDIADVVARWTGIPITRMMESERTKLLTMEERLHERVIGQEEAVRAVSNAIRRSRAGLQDQHRPIGSFIFLGTTGVGKTELARSLAAFLFDDERAMIRIDMSEYMEKFAVSRLIGAPPGYVGYEEGGQLTEAVRRRPYSVILLDEIEKAHPDVFNILLQLLDDGRLTDSQGRVVDFSNAIVIMTSNLGSHLIQEKLLQNPDDRQRAMGQLRGELTGLLRKTLKPEFLNRIDDVVIFNPLSENEIRLIVDKLISEVNARLAESGIELEVPAETRDWIAKLGFDPTFGARPLKRVIQKHISNPLASEILMGNYTSGDTVRVAADDSGSISFHRESHE